MIRPVPLSEEALRLAAEAILRGEVVVYPTETLYGLAADATSAESVRRVFLLKGRPPDKPAPLIAADLDMVVELVESVPPGAYKLIERFWPGPLTLIFDARPSLPEELTGGSGTVGIRVSSGDVARRLVAKVQRPITATSANLSGRGDPSDPEIIKKDFGEGISLMIDAGKMDAGPGSTIVDPRGDYPLILREGVITANRVLEAWNSR